MIELPKEIKSIKGSVSSFVDKGTERYAYILNEGTDKEFHLTVLLPYSSRPDISFDIIDDSREFVNGFKLVQTANMEYAYVKEEDSTLLPFRYDIATDFNEYGYAMVGKDGKVSWIDKNFKYLNSKYEMVKEDSSKFNGFLSVSDFSKGEHPLSKVCSCGYDWNMKTSYFGVDGKIKKFARYDGEIIRDGDSIKKFSYYSEDFNDKGYATANNDWLILLSSGYYLSAKNLIRICEEKGFLDTMNNKIEKQERNYIKFLRDVEKKTMDFLDNISQTINLETEYNIIGIESRNQELISQYGEDVYKRAIEEVNNNYRKLAFLTMDNLMITQVIDITLFQNLLAKRGIPSYIDSEENVFHYNAINHVKKKK